MMNHIHFCPMSKLSFLQLPLTHGVTRSTMTSHIDPPHWAKTKQYQYKYWHDSSSTTSTSGTSSTTSTICTTSTTSATNDFVYDYDCDCDFCY